QHGTTADENKRAVDFAQRAMALSDDPETRLHFALAADRWLLSTRKKQLFGTQAMQRPSDAGLCACLVPVQPDFPDDVRKKYGEKTLADQQKWIESLRAQPCGPVTCDIKPDDVPRGTFPGVW